MSKPLAEMLALRPEARPRFPARNEAVLDRIDGTAYNDGIDVIR
jgi:hypothetical protein